MIRTPVISMILAAQATAAQPLVEGGPERMDKRAEVFSTVCMAAAPDFSRFEDKAAGAGLKVIDGGWHMAPETVVSLVSHDGFCTCLMSVGAPDQKAMVTTIFDRLMQDWGTDFTGKADGLANVAPFQRAGVEVVSILEPRTLNGQNWLEARLSVYGACPDAEGSQ
ncbi:hypothetical protein [Antarctobacter jejuensis]|uniref:hypothetical protein n=1 Tax=Antarctobacter jejuensis TaxID=1439938 RepID=UPI003FCF0B28